MMIMMTVVEEDDEYDGNADANSYGGARSNTFQLEAKEGSPDLSQAPRSQ